MPETPPAVSNPQSPKHTESDSGWTQVKPKYRRTKHRPSHHQTTALIPDQPPHKRHTGSTRSPSAIEAEYRTIQSNWEDSACHAQLRQLIIANAASAHAVSHAVCLGIGSFDPPDGAWEAKRRTFLQLIAFLAMVKELERIKKQPITCYFQEPIFSESDILFIHSLGCQILDSPHGFDKVDEQSFLFGIHLYRPVYALALQSLPAIFVGTGWDVWDQVTLAPTNDIDNLQRMDCTYVKAQFPKDGSTTAFSSTSIYWRPESSQRRLSGTTTNHSPAVASDLLE